MLYEINKILCSNHYDLCYVFDITYSLCYVSVSTYSFIIFKQVFLKDTDERACAYISGPAPNRWGVTFEGLELLESVSQISRTDGESLPRSVC